MTVLEVLIAIGVASVGLLGVILLIPLADHQMNEGAKLERANQLGANAFREFQVLGINNPLYWRAFNASGNPTTLTLPDNLTVAPSGSLPQSQYRYRRAFCIDPRFAAVNGAVLGPNNEDPTLFPYVVDSSATILSMPRISLWSRRSTASPADLNEMMGLLQADSNFLALDDLEFRRPKDDRTLPPVQLNNAGGEDDNDGDGDIDGDWNPLETNPQPTERARKAYGRMSWLATLVPNEKIGGNGDEYVLSVVVFHNRDPSFAMDPPANESANERVARILGGDPTATYNGFFSGGVGGGTVALMPRNTGLSQTAAALQLEVRAGDWVLLSRTNEYIPRWPDGSPRHVDSNGNPVSVNGPRSHRWYRVLAADSALSQEDTDGNGTPDEWAHFITLEGPDWPIDQTTQVTLVKDVIAVFEKTVRLDASSLWTD